MAINGKEREEKMTTQKRVVIQITRDLYGSDNPSQGYVFWPDHAALSYNVDKGIWFDMNGYCKGTSIYAEAIAFLFQSAEFKLEPGERQLLEMKTI
jgi:hypothetical protein